MLATPSIAEVNDLTIQNETVSGNAVRNACESITIGPNVSVDTAGRLRMQTQLHTFLDAVTVEGRLAAMDVCLDSADLTATITTPAGYDICLPPQDFDIEASGFPVGTATLCGSSLCPDGITSGCTLHLTATSATVDFGTSTVEATVIADDTDLDLLLDFTIGGDETCNVSFENASGDVLATFSSTAVCSAQYAEVLGLSTFQFTPSYTLDVSECTYSGILDLVTGLVGPYINIILESLAQSIFEQELTGLWVCSP